MFSWGERVPVESRIQAWGRRMALPLQPFNRANPSANGGRITPTSVMNPVTKACGVTSNAGLMTAVSCGAMRSPRPYHRAMTREEVDRFVQYFERLTLWVLEEMPERADVLIEIDERHRLRPVRGVDLAGERA